MLQQIRDRITGWVAGLVILMIAVAFIFWGIDFGFGAKNYAAKVNGEEISLVEFRRVFQNQIAQFQQYYQNEVPAELRVQMRDNLLERFIRNELLEQRTRNAGYRIGDDVLHEYIQSIPAFQIDGQFSLERYHSALRTQGYEPAFFESQQRRSLEVSQLQDAIAGTAFATPAELRRYTQLEDEQRAVAYLVIPHADHLAAAAVDEASIQQYYEAGRNRYMTPESVTLQYLEVRAEDLAEDVAVTEEQLRAVYEAGKAAGRFAAPEERQARHILIEIADDEQAARGHAEQLLAQIEAGEDFAALAREHSADPGSATRGGELDWGDREAFVGAFSDTLFALEPNQVRGPVRTQFGFHLIRLEGIRGGEVPGFEAVRAELEQEYREREAESRYHERAEDLDREAFEAEDELESVAEMLDLELQGIAGFTRSGGGELGADPQVIEAAFTTAVLEDGENSPLLQLAPDHALVLRVTDHRAAERKSLEQVRAEVEAELKREAAEAAARDIGESIVAQLEAGADFKSLAAEHGGDFHDASFTTRSEAGIPTELLTSIFRAPRPGEQGAVIESLQLNTGDYAVVQISAVRSGDPAALAADQRLSRQQQLAAQSGTGDVAAYVSTLRRDARIVINRDEDGSGGGRAGFPPP